MLRSMNSVIVRRRFVLLAFGALAICGPVRRTYACGQRASPDGRTIWPVGGSVGVPTNARVVVKYHLTIGELAPERAHAWLTDIQLRTASGDSIPVPVTITMLPVFARYWERDTAILVTPVQPLMPNTTYEVLDRLSLPCTPSRGCPLTGFQVVSTFTTGSGPDHTSPDFSSEVLVSFGDPETTSSSCGAGSAGQVRIEWQPASDNGPLLYTLDRDGAGTPPLPYINATSVEGEYICDGDPALFGFAAVQIVPGTYRVGAIDLAGNQMRSKPFLIRPPYERCAAEQAPPIRSDGIAPPDSQGLDAGAPSPEVGGSGDIRPGGEAPSGCEAAGVNAGRNSAWWVLILAGGLVSRRGPRRRAHQSQH